MPELGNRKYRVQIKNVQIWLPFISNSLGCLWAMYFLYPLWSGITIIVLIYSVLIVLPFVREIWIKQTSLCLTDDGIAYQMIISVIPTAYGSGYIRWGNIIAMERYSSHSKAFAAAVVGQEAGILTKIAFKMCSIWIVLGFNRGDYVLIRYHSGGLLFSPAQTGEIPGRIFYHSPAEIVIVNIALLAEAGDMVFTRMNQYWQYGKKAQTVPNV